MLHCKCLKTRLNDQSTRRKLIITDAILNFALEQLKISSIQVYGKCF